MTIVLALFVFTLIVVIHELGHFWAARANGVTVEEFAIGMGPKLLSTVKNGIRYSIRMLPIGGFCKMVGEDEDSDDEGALNRKGVSARLVIMAAGALMNFVLAFVLIFVLDGVGGFLEPVIGELMPGYPAIEAGIQPGDRIVALNGQSVLVNDDLYLIMYENTGEELAITVKRDGEKIDYKLTPKLSEDGSQYLMGFTRTGKSGLFGKPIESFTRAGLFETIRHSAGTLVFYVKSTIIGLVRLVTLKFDPSQMAGPIGIVNIIGESFQVGLKESIIAAILNVMAFAALLSANLGAFNLLPLPALDGGRILFLLIEGIRRKPIDPSKEGMVHFAGFVLLMALMVFVAYNDIVRLL